MKSLFNIISDYEYRKDYCQKYLSEQVSHGTITEKQKTFRIFSAEYILSEKCEQDLSRLRSGDLFFEPPRLSTIPKGGGRYRKVYHFDGTTIALLSLIARALHETYDHIFSKDLYSYRKGVGCSTVCSTIRKAPGIDDMYCYRVDASTYDQTIDCSQLQEMIRKKIDDAEMADFLCRFADFRRYTHNGVEYNDGPAVMTGSSLTPFFDNLYLSDYDEEIAAKCQVYCRYSDDIIMYGSRDQIENCIEYTREVFEKKKLVLNDTKAGFYAPGEDIEYLDMLFCGSLVGIANKVIDGLRNIVRKKTRAFLKMKRKLGLSDEFAMKIALKYIDSYSEFYEGFFEFISRVDGVREIDRIMQDALRTVGSGRFSNGKYRIKYYQLRKIGYRPLISKYYSWEWKNNRKK